MVNEKLVLVGVNGVSIDTLEAKSRAGLLPSFARLAGQGELRPLISPVPPGSIAAWASLAAGVLPERHGIFLHDELWEGGLRPAGHAAWQAAPLWERLAQAGVATAGIGWPATIPGAAWEGQHVDPRYAVASGLTREDWPLPLDVAPAELREDLREYRIHPTEVDPRLVAPMLPENLALKHDNVARLTSALAQTATAQVGLDLLLAKQDWSALFVFLDWPRSAAGALYANVLPDAAWILLDQSIAELLAKIAPTATVLIASLSTEGPGFLVARGDGYRAGVRTSAASTLSVAPSVLKHFGWSDPSLAAPNQHLPHTLKVLPGRPRAAAKKQAEPRSGDLQHLAEFGLAPPKINSMWRQRRLIAEAEILMGEDSASAARLAEQALAEGPDSIAALGILAVSRVDADDPAPLFEIADRIAAIDPDHLWRDLVLAAAHALSNDEARARPHLERVAREGAVDDRLRAASLWLMLGRRSKAAAMFRDVLSVSPNHLGALLGLLSTETVAGIEAEGLLRRVLTLQPGHPGARAALVSLLRAVGRSAEAARVEGA